MSRWVFVLVIAGITWLALMAQDRGASQRMFEGISNAEIPDWEPAANHPASDRPEDAFQRAWNKSEKRVHAAMAAEGEPE